MVESQDHWRGAALACNDTINHIWNRTGSSSEQHGYPPKAFRGRRGGSRERPSIMQFDRQDANRRRPVRASRWVISREPPVCQILPRHTGYHQIPWVATETCKSRSPPGRFLHYSFLMLPSKRLFVDDDLCVIVGQDLEMKRSRRVQSNPVSPKCQSA